MSHAEVDDRSRTERVQPTRTNKIGLFHVVISMGHTLQICNGNHGNGKH